MEVNNMENIVQDHERRIVQLEKQAEETKNQYLRLENTVLTGNQRQEDLLNRLIDHHFKAKENDTTSAAQVKTSKAQIWAAALGGGGVFAVIAGAITLLIK